MNLSDNENAFVKSVTPVQTIKLLATLRPDQVTTLMGAGDTGEFDAGSFLRSFTLDQVSDIVSVFTDEQRTMLLLLSFEAYFRGELS